MIPLPEKVLTLAAERNPYRIVSMKRLLVLGLTVGLLLIGQARVRGSVRVDQFGEGVEYTTQFETWDAGGITIMAWVYVSSIRGPSIYDQSLVAIRGAGILYVAHDDNKLRMYTGSSQNWDNNTIIPINEWHHFALVRVAGTRTWRAYLDGVLNFSGQNLIEPTGDPHPFFGNDDYGDWLDGRMAAGKIWLATLNQAEIQAEMGSYAAVRTANIWSVVPMHVHTDLTDQSGQGNTPTAMGSLSTEPDPPLATTASISGRVAYADTVTAGKNVTMTLTAPSFTTQTTTTDANGNYTFVGVPTGNSYTLTPSKTGDIRGLESLDASETARYVVGLAVPSANQRIAADADGDGSLASFDASLIARYVVGLPGSGIVGTWKFVLPSRSYSPLSGDQTSQNFTAILVGDTGGNWTPSLPAGKVNRQATSFAIRSVPQASAQMSRTVPVGFNRGAADNGHYRAWEGVCSGCFTLSRYYLGGWLEN